MLMAIVDPDGLSISNVGGYATKLALALLPIVHPLAIANRRLVMKVARCVTLITRD